MLITKNHVVAVLAGAVSLVLLPWMAFNMFEDNDASTILVIQSPTGSLDVLTDPGIKWQGFGKVTVYPRRAQYSFTAPKKGSNEADTSKKLRFNDGGHAQLSGAVSWEMPLDEKSVIAVHKAFSTAEGIQQLAVAKMLDSAIYLAGPLMSSTESSGERRAELVQYINDQAENGVYVTKSEEIKTRDEANNEKTSIVTRIVFDDKGLPKRQQGSILKEFNIKLLPLAISDLNYDPIVENQIKQRQEATTQVQIAQANARRAQQDAITIAAQGEATAAKAKWDQETIKAKEVTLAQQKLEVAKLAAAEAGEYKRQQILIGEGDAERKRLVMNADGNLTAKLEAYREVNLAYATAIKDAKSGAWTPSVVMGGNDGKSGNAANQLVELLTTQTAKQLALDLSVKGDTSR